MIFWQNAAIAVPCFRGTTIVPVAFLLVPSTALQQLHNNEIVCIVSASIENLGSKLLTDLLQAGTIRKLGINKLERDSV